MGSSLERRGREYIGDPRKALATKPRVSLLVDVIDALALRKITPAQVRDWLIRNGAVRRSKDRSTYTFGGGEIKIHRKDWSENKCKEILQKLHEKTGKSELFLWAEITGHEVIILPPIRVTEKQLDWVRTIYASGQVDAWRVPPQAMEGLLTQGLVETIERRRGKLARLSVRGEQWLKALLK